MNGKINLGSRINVSDIVFENMMDSITKGVWCPGERIPSENKLASLYGVSRVTVRAAIQRLSSLGVLESTQGDGTYVCRPSTENRLDSMLSFFALSRPDRANVFEFRYTVEAGAVALAAKRADAAHIERMRDATRRMEEAAADDAITECDLEFHRLIAEGSGNPIFLKVFDVMCSTYRALLKGNVIIMGAAGAKYHYAIIDAIEARDAEMARLLLTRHLDHTIISTGEYAEGEPGFPCRIHAPCDRPQPRNRRSAMTSAAGGHK